MYIFFCTWQDYKRITSAEVKGLIITRRIKSLEDSKIIILYIDTQSPTHYVAVNARNGLSLKPELQANSSSAQSCHVHQIPLVL